VIFTISTLPKIYFHNVIANHVDAIQLCDHPEKSKACLHQKIFHCETENLVVTSPYLFVSAIPGISLSKIFVEINAFFLSALFHHCVLYKENRGPPSVLS
jgi:hypothetical protein